MTFASYFCEAANEIADAINETMGELVWVTPTLFKPNFLDSPDLSLQPFQITMVFTHKAHTAFSDKSAYRPTGSKEIEIAVAIQTRKPIFSVMACQLPYQIKQQYRIQRCFDQTLWSVTNIKPNGISRLEIDVVQLGRASQLDRPNP